MTTINIGTPQVDGQARRRPGLEWAQLQVGHNLTLRVLHKIAQERYAAEAGGERHIVQSKLQLRNGEAIRARVVAVGEKVELKYLGPDQSTARSRGDGAPPFDDDVAGQSLLALQEKHAVTLTHAEQHAILGLSRSVSQPQMLALGGLFLNKLGMPLDGSSLQALYAAQAWHKEDVGREAVGNDVSALVHAVQAGDTQARQHLAKLMGDMVDPAGSNAVDDVGPQAAFIAASGADNGGGESQHRGESDAQALQELARSLLNAPDQGSVAYHFGTLPVMIADQLVELDLVLFRERESASRLQGVKKLVMSLRTQALGRIEIIAQSLESHLTVSIRSESFKASNALALHGGEVRELASRLGWNVDSVSYRADAEPQRAAVAIISHVLAAGTLDTVI